MKEIQEHEISNTLHRGLSVVPKTDGEIYVSTSIGEYIITFTCFLHCAKKGRYRKNIYAKVVENAKINFSVGPYLTLWFSRKKNLKFFEVALEVVLCNDVLAAL